MKRVRAGFQIYWQIDSIVALYCKMVKTGIHLQVLQYFSDLKIYRLVAYFQYKFRSYFSLILHSSR